MQVNIDKNLFLELYNEWRKNNSSELHPLTKFFDITGLEYIKRQNKTYWVCEVLNQKKYMLAKIKYGI